jgi:hypothetical protein
MTVMSRLSGRLAVLSALVACALPLTAAAQSVAYGDVSGSGDAPEADSSKGDGKPSRSSRGRRGTGGKRTVVEPYIEAAQVVTAELSPGDDVLTYSVIAAGVDAEVVGLNNAASVSLRYERRFGWGDAEDSDAISGIARGYATVAPGVQIEAGGLAARTRVEEGGAAVLGPLRDDDAVTQVYSVYAGPSISTHAGDVAVTANYRIGYTKVEEPDAFTAAPGAPAVDVFDESTVHVADVHAGVKPHDVLPVGLGVGAGYYREDISNLDQRVEDFHARADVTVPVTPSLALVAGIGYEDVEISSRDAVRDANGVPVVGPNGRFVTDKSEPRILAYDVDGLIWDAGVMWRPSPRTALEAHVGRRFGSTSVYGTFAYTPNTRSSFNVAVYDNVAGFGGQVNRALADLPAEFSAVRNPLSGDIGGCVATLEQNGCLSGVLGSVRSATFRARGVIATYAYEIGRITTGIGAGYDRRRFIAAPGTVLGLADGVVDENYWLAAYLNARLDRRSTLSTNIYANWFQSDSSFADDVTAMGAVAAYNRHLTDHLSATAAVGLDGVNRDDPFEDFWNASALLGVRYSF